MGTRSSVYSIRLSYPSLLAIMCELDRLQVEYTTIAGAMGLFINMKLAETGADLTDPEDKAFDLVAERLSITGKARNERRKAEHKQQPLHMNRRGGESLAGLDARMGRKQSGAVLQSAQPATSNDDFNPMLMMASNASNFEPLLETSDTRASPSNLQGFGLDEVLSKGREILAEQEAQLDEDASDDLDTILHQMIAEQEAEDAEKLMAKLTGGFSVKLDASVQSKTKRDLPALSERDGRLAKDKLYQSLVAEANEPYLYALRILYHNLPEEYWSTEKAEQMLLQILQSL